MSPCACAARPCSAPCAAKNAATNSSMAGQATALMGEGGSADTNTRCTRTQVEPPLLLGLLPLPVRIRPPVPPARDEPVGGCMTASQKPVHRRSSTVAPVRLFASSTTATLGARGGCPSDLAAASAV